MNAWSYSVMVHGWVLAAIIVGIVLAVRDAIQQSRRDRRRRRR